MQSDRLKNLPGPVKSLVNDGVYSLYEVKLAGCAYVLMTNKRETYALNEDGEVIPSLTIPSVEALDLGRTIRFPEVHSGSVLTLNYA